MTSLSVPASLQTRPSVRALSAVKDLPQVADLIEACFAKTMDSEGRRYVRHMRRAGHDEGFRRWATRLSEGASLPLTGYVWEESGKIVGNASLIPFHTKGGRIYLIANVAVHPDFRRQGIARALTEHSMAHALQRRAQAVWLNVRADNPVALKLYSELGFVERARRTLWGVEATAPEHVPATMPALLRRHPRFWAQQRNWLDRLYPSELAWHRHWDFSAIRPGFWIWLLWLMIDAGVQQWAAVNAGELEAVLAYIPAGHEEVLFAAAGPETDPRALTALLLHARRSLPPQPPLSLELPAGEFDSAIREAGFTEQRTLVWMRAPVAT
jgi:ribosomal protein S18 acetylase RimI-like enzyme